MEMSRSGGTRGEEGGEKIDWGGERDRSADGRVLMRGRGCQVGVRRTGKIV